MAGNHTWVRQLDEQRAEARAPRRAVGIFTNSQENIERFGPDPGLAGAVERMAALVGGVAKQRLDVQAALEEHQASKTARAVAVQRAMQLGLRRGPV